MVAKKYILHILTALMLISCIREDVNDVNIENHTGPVTVGFVAGGAQKTRTTIDDNGISTSWSPEDKVALWALNEETQSFSLNKQMFKMYFRHPESRGYFTSTLNAAMADGNYTYYATYPTPTSVNGTTATFNLPDVQDGQMGGGVAIMVAEPQTGKAALSALTNTNASDEIFDNGLHLNMHHKMHALRMFIPHIPTKEYYGFGNEKVVRIDLALPWNIAGTISTDISDEEAAPVLTGNGSRYMSLFLKNPIGATTANGNTYAYDYAYASIIPAPIGDTNIYNGELVAEVFTSTKAAKTTISLSNLSSTHTFAAGHITPVVLNCSKVVDRHAIRLTWMGNNLGEDINTIYFYDATGAEVYRINDVASFVSTGIHDVEYTFVENKSEILSSLAGQTLTVKYESDNAIVSNTITMPTTLATEVKCHEVGITVPYLFFEDFTSIHTNFEFDDKRVASLMSADGHLLNDYMSVSGWNGAHIKGVAGQSVRVNVRHQSTLGVTRSNGRLDTPAISTLKSGAKVKLKVTFDMGAYVDSGYDSGNDVFLVAGTHTSSESSALDGVTDTKAFSSVDDDATRVVGVFNNVALKTGNIPNNFTNDSFNSEFPTYSFTVDGCGATTRLCWVPCCSQGTFLTSNNAHYYLYFDNIKVQIVRE